MKIICLLTLFLCSLFATSCKSDLPTTTATNTSRIDSITLYDPSSDFSFPSDSASIDTAWIASDNLSLAIHYGGGCKRHRFKFFAWNVFLHDFIPEVVGFLSHDGNGDQYAIPQFDTLTFSLLPLKDNYFSWTQSDSSSEHKLYLIVNEPIPIHDNRWLLYSFYGKTHQSK